ncbi:hypothetical protein XSR1_280009 [Xenorhabdus szentirmaii DSM 16338]|uniref:Uncharacterized protein n=1 Tax=Xenorhabdus szentirmaii DSM 16338 TaxID=1427518 RepID=W1IZI8_9GAMM|nr:hypothetical protein XSR1_280009 [Xenorhabdus szentirmaii DSM 16338]
MLAHSLTPVTVFIKNMVIDVPGGEVKGRSLSPEAGKFVFLPLCCISKPIEYRLKR